MISIGYLHFRKEKFIMIISISDAAELKKAAEEKLSAKLHFHDGCGGQYFTAEEPSAELRDFIAGYLAAKSMKAIFSADGSSFSVDRA
ncbi:MAG: hypothetical protein ACI4J5_04335 [Oscillospiraceae bacterium]